MIYKQNPAFFVDFSRKKKTVHVSKHTYIEIPQMDPMAMIFFLDRDENLLQATYCLYSPENQRQEISPVVFTGF